MDESEEIDGDCDNLTECSPWFFSSFLPEGHLSVDLGRLVFVGSLRCLRFYCMFNMVACFLQSRAFFAFEQP